MLIYAWHTVDNDNDNYKILSYFHKSVAKLILDIFEDQWEGVVMVKRPII